MVDRIVSSSLVAAVAAVLAGCAVGPDYREPTLELPQQFDSAETTRYSTGDADLGALLDRVRRRTAGPAGDARTVHQPRPAHRAGAR